MMRSENETKEFDDDVQIPADHSPKNAINSQSAKVNSSLLSTQFCGLIAQNCSLGSRRELSSEITEEKARIKAQRTYFHFLEERVGAWFFVRAWPDNQQSRWTLRQATREAPEPSHGRRKSD